MAYRVLCIEDDPGIGRLVASELTARDYRCDWERDGAIGLKRFASDHHDLILLDLTLPSVDGLDICRRIRSTDPHTPIIMVTARAATRDVVLGLEIGADDYITKPFSVQVLAARIHALLRRRGPRSEDADLQPIVRGPLMVDPLKHRVTVHGRPVELTAKEFALLALFANHPGRSFSRGELLDRVWGIEFEGYDHTVNTHINRLRGKIEADAAQPRFILTVWGIGYRFPELDQLGGTSEP